MLEKKKRGIIHRVENTAKALTVIGPMKANVRVYFDFFGFSQGER